MLSAEDNTMLTQTDSDTPDGRVLSTLLDARHAL